MLLDVCRRQWNALRRIDHFRREGVSNLSHDLRSPLTATVACLETLDGRWADASGARRRPPPGRDRAAQHAQRRRAWCARSATWPSSTSPSTAAPRRSTSASCSTTSSCASPSGRRSKASRARAAGRRAPARRRRYAAHRRRAVRAGDRQPGRQRAQVLPDAGGTRDAAGAATRRRRSRSPSPTTGRGIAAADLPHLFDRFYQSRPRSRRATGDGGHGLGLAIVKRIVELHEGEVAVESSLGQGTRVTTRWPAAG